MSKKPSPEKVRKQIVKTYLKAVRKLKRTPTEADLRDFGLTRHKIRWHFKNPKDLKNYCKENYPEAFKNIIDESVFTEENMGHLRDLVSNHSTVVVSSVVTGCKVHKGFYKAIKNYTNRTKGVDLYIPVTDPASDASWDIAPELGEDHIVFGDLALNSNLYISGIKMSAKQNDPTTGLNRMGHKRSFIFGSPKQRLKFKPNAIRKSPHASMGTGAVTQANYNTSRYMSERTAKLAEVDHKIGAIIVELESDDIYHFRQIQANESGAFADMGKLYMPDGRVLDYAPEFFVMGDLHPGETDPSAFSAWKEAVTSTNTKNVVVHDGFNGHSISHWVEGKILDKARMASKGLTSLREEGKLCADHLKEILSWLPKNGKLYMVGSNHNDFLYRYLNDKRFVRDYENLDFVVKDILPKAMAGEDPCKVLVELFLTKEEKARIIWWDVNQDYRFAGVELAAHGDKGPNGSRGTIKNQEESYGACIIGHGHSSGIYREAYQVGTSTHTELPYTKGASSWTQTSCFLYRNGSRQLIHSIKGKIRK